MKVDDYTLMHQLPKKIQHSDTKLYPELASLNKFLNGSNNQLPNLIAPGMTMETPMFILSVSSSM